MLELPSYEAALEWTAKIAAACRCAQQPPAFQYDSASVRDPKEIDVTFDFRSDTPTGKDPDTFSPTLRSTHRRLWGRPLPNGALFHLDASNRRRYLYHESDLGRFFLSSDAIIRTFCRHPRAASIMAQIPEAEQEAFNRQGYTIGGMMVFPGNRINNKQTINQRRGITPASPTGSTVTLECIRRHYLGQASPLADTLELTPSSSTCLATSGATWISSSCRDDLVVDGLAHCPVPPAVRPHSHDSGDTEDPDEYLLYRQASLEFVGARNASTSADFVASQSSLHHSSFWVALERRRRAPHR